MFIKQLPFDRLQVDVLIHIKKRESVIHIGKSFMQYVCTHDVTVQKYISLLTLSKSAKLQQRLMRVE